MKAGKFAVASFARATDSTEARTKFGDKVFASHPTSSSKKNAHGLKEYELWCQKFINRNVSMVDEIALTRSNISFTHPIQKDSCD